MGRSNQLGTLAIALWALAIVFFTSQAFSLLEGTVKISIKSFFDLTDIVQSNGADAERNPEKWLGE